MTVPRTVLVTGAYGVIGGAIALRLARETGSEVLMSGRDPRRLEAAADAVRPTLP